MRTVQSLNPRKPDVALCTHKQCITKFEHVCVSLTSIKVKLDFLSGFIKAVDACYNQYRHRNKLKFDHSHKRLRADLTCNDALYTDWQFDDNKMSDRASYVKVTREAQSIRETIYKRQRKLSSAKSQEIVNRGTYCRRYKRNVCARNLNYHFGR